MNDALHTNDEELQDLLTGALALSAFAEAQKWSERAAIEIERLKGFMRELDAEIARGTQFLEKLSYERSKKMLGGLLGGNKEEKELSRQVEEWKTSKSGLAKAVHQLQEVLDFTPRSLAEKESLLTELRKRKRKLQEEKREITQVARGPRLNRQPEPEAGFVFDTAARDRRKARYQREAELKPGETTVAALTRQIEQAERDIQWVDKLEE